MAYARFANDSDVYVYADVAGGFACERCPRIGETFHCATPGEMVRHLLVIHRGNGHRVPEDALDELREETANNDPAPNVELELWSPNRKQKAEIRRRADGVFQVVLSREFFEDGPYGSYTYWSSTNREAILTDSLERARSLAEEELRLLGDEPDHEPRRDGDNTS